MGFLRIKCSAPAINQSNQKAVKPPFFEILFSFIFRAHISINKFSFTPREGAATTVTASILMVPSVRDGAHWDGSCCALKLVKLAAGNFDTEHHHEQPSWTIAGSSPTASENNKSTDGLLSAGINRSVRGAM